jgi:hypothetical protein
LRLLSTLALLGTLASAFVPALAHADASEGKLVDGVALRFYAPETGGPGRPRFITHRILAFEARLESLIEDPSGTTNGAITDRHIRAAMDRHIAEELLASLPLERQPDEAEIARVVVELRAGLLQRIGGERSPAEFDLVLADAAAAEGLAPEEVNQILRRRARAALYLERAVAPLLFPTEEQLRDVYRTSAHPYRGVKFEDARLQLSRWFVDERLRSSSTAFLQAARSRVKIIPSPKH